jgi:hypothetical protein
MSSDLHYRALCSGCWVWSLLCPFYTAWKSSYQGLLIVVERASVSILDKLKALHVLSDLHSAHKFMIYKSD